MTKVRYLDLKRHGLTGINNKNLLRHMKHNKSKHPYSTLILWFVKQKSDLNQNTDA